METMRIGFAMSGSFCTFDRAVEQVEQLVARATR